MTIEERIQAIIVEQLGVDEKEVTESASFIEDLGADSLDTVELVMAFEEEFDIEIPDEDAEEIATVAMRFAISRTKRQRSPSNVATRVTGGPYTQGWSYYDRH